MHHALWPLSSQSSGCPLQEYEYAIRTSFKLLCLCALCSCNKAGRSKNKLDVSHLTSAAITTYRVVPSTITYCLWTLINQGWICLWPKFIYSWFPAHLAHWHSNCSCQIWNTRSQNLQDWEILQFSVSDFHTAGSSCCMPLKNWHETLVQTNYFFHALWSLKLWTINLNFLKQGNPRTSEISLQFFITQRGSYRLRRTYIHASSDSSNETTEQENLSAEASARGTKKGKGNTLTLTPSGQM